MSEKWVVNASPIISLAKLNIVKAKKKRKIEAVAPFLKQLDEIGFRINQDLFDAAVDLAGEK